MLRRRLGTVATLAAGLMLAVSPGAVYLSRYFIHETLFVFFTLGIVVAGVKLYDERNPAYLIPAAASAALLFATKETAMISVGVLIIAFALTLVTCVSTASSCINQARGEAGNRRGSADFIEELGDTTNFFFQLGLALLFFLRSISFSIRRFSQTQKASAIHCKRLRSGPRPGDRRMSIPPLMYFTWLLRIEAPLLFLGAVGAVIVVVKPRNSLALFCALWAFGLIAAYSLIPYKTPWLVLNFIVPLAVIAGYAVQAIYEMDHGQLRLVSAISRRCDRRLRLTSRSI